MRLPCRGEARSYLRGVHGVVHRAELSGVEGLEEPIRDVPQRVGCLVVCYRGVNRPRSAARRAGTPWLVEQHACVWRDRTARCAI
jgi:hypothetical protein